MANLDPDAKCNDGQRHGEAGQSSHRLEESASEAESVKKPEEKSYYEKGSAAAAMRPANILERDNDDAKGDHRLDDFWRHSHEVENSEGERNGMSEGEDGDHVKEHPETRDRESECADEKQMIVAGENVPDSMAHIISGQPPGAGR